MYLLAIKLCILCIPAVSVLWATQHAKASILRKSRISLIGFAILLLVAWPVFGFVLFLGFSIGGGNPSVLQIVVPALLMSSPLPAAAGITLAAARFLKRRIGAQASKDA
ncbi:hypothetical protein RA19_04120 [Leisingera sp. ANG-M1]|uniref:hypothetical protein n=1 Tax=Leisingera sp. ANG-M1 TaxID=1577895 RepID=UPI00057FDD74|nr:hypothetical protein [Leisingera sp. ANG-M1]KIC11831.1 hypothetical protein RA19_04120 [Leisingera sp. ANG-M1]